MVREETTKRRVKYTTSLVVEDDEVAVRDVEAREVVHGVLGIVDVLIDDECRTARVLIAPSVGGEEGGLCARQRRR